MSLKRKIARQQKPQSSLRSCCPTHQTNDLALLLQERFLGAAKALSVDGKLDSLAVILACEMLKRNMIDSQEAAYASRGDEAGLVEFRTDLERDLGRIMREPDPEAH